MKIFKIINTAFHIVNKVGISGGNFYYAIVSDESYNICPPLNVVKNTWTITGVWDLKVLYCRYINDINSTYTFVNVQLLYLPKLTLFVERVLKLLKHIENMYGHGITVVNHPGKLEIQDILYTIYKQRSEIDVVHDIQIDVALINKLNSIANHYKWNGK